MKATPAKHYSRQALPGVFHLRKKNGYPWVAVKSKQ